MLRKRNRNITVECNVSSQLCFVSDLDLPSLCGLEKTLEKIRLFFLGEGEKREERKNVHSTYSPTPTQSSAQNLR
jgi:hypothetical protein